MYATVQYCVRNLKDKEKKKGKKEPVKQYLHKLKFISVLRLREKYLQNDRDV